MSTYASITAKLADGRYAAIYLHSDGYVSYAGRILHEHYSTPELAEKLVTGGDLSVLAESCDSAPGHTFTSKVPGHCVYYGRDRGEKDVGPIMHELLYSAACDVGWQNYNYVYDGTRWLLRVGKRQVDGCIDIPTALVWAAGEIDLPPLSECFFIV